MSMKIREEIKRTWDGLIYPALSPILFLISMFQIFVFTDVGGINSLLTFLIGWAMWLGWYANIFYIFSLLARRTPRVSFLYCLLAFILAITITIPLNIPLRRSLTVFEYGWGFYLWIMAIVVHMIRQAGFLWFEGSQGRKSFFVFLSLGVIGCISIFFLHQSNHGMNFKIYLILF
ncbi:hypothetical protein [Pseudomonas syringae]|uniref:Uncharacterized protein n=1 Tax=Pseudomonas syringae pv. actinidiae TaxID=103796 RepID=A0A7Z6UBN9_PSESF|nr:hypothetical protein [Pseudomonas syringae]RMP83679.1 hypothetical protein ALQ15_200129 [Pseudomonas syringae pv. actinidiae]